MTTRTPTRADEWLVDSPVLRTFIDAVNDVRRRESDPHDLRTPLTSILGNALTLEQGVDTVRLADATTSLTTALRSTGRRGGDRARLIPPLTACEHSEHYRSGG